MKLAPARLAAFTACALLAAPAFAASQDASEPQDAETQSSAEAMQEEEDAAPAPAAEAKEEKRICRRVRLDMSSRRATRVCKTAEEWRLFNQRR